jgi:hypothetical protein
MSVLKLIILGGVDIYDQRLDNKTNVTSAIKLLGKFQGSWEGSGDPDADSTSLNGWFSRLLCPSQHIEIIPARYQRVPGVARLTPDCSYHSHRRPDLGSWTWTEAPI